ncbi:MAG: hypothetical protein LBK03_02900 [Bacteroidales bacterium]|jgi:hypothetical protein|nr:hypothetical protein [Bacteroidales bacterium]
MKVLFTVQNIGVAVIFMLLYGHNCKADTITMMQYNLMYYTTSTPANCPPGATYLDEKDANLKQIIKYINPDVFCVNEIGSNIIYVNRILNNVLNSDGVTYYAACPLTNHSGGGYSSIANMLYYDSRKMAFHSHFYITATRDINAYKLYYKSNSLTSGDTIFITFIIAHLKAGNYAERRGQEAASVMNRLVQLPAANYVLSGDFNLYNANEPAYQQFINYSNNFYAFYDPVAGSWNQMHHTQSTHTSSSGSCFSTGGMDDRFDFILVSPYIYYGNNRVKAITDSYRAVGQDGNRYDRTINNPPNNAVPDYIANALYNLSDHIPVTMLFDINAPLAIANATQNWSINVVNPVREQLDMQLSTLTSGCYTFDIYTVDGRPIAHFERMCTAGNNRINYPLNIPAGFYLLKISDTEGRNGNVQSQKIVKY